MWRIVCGFLVLVIALGHWNPILAETFDGKYPLNTTVDECDVDLKAGNPVTIVIIGETDTRMSVTLEDLGGNTVAIDSSWSDTCTLHITPLVSGTYRIKLLRDGDAIGAYGIALLG